MKRVNKTPMDKLTAGYEKFIEGKELKKNSKKLFEKIIKKAVATKQRATK